MAPAALNRIACFMGIGNHTTLLDLTHFRRPLSLPSGLPCSSGVESEADLRL